MKSFMRLVLSIAILFAIASPVFAKEDTPRFDRYQGFEAVATWDHSTDDARITTSIQIYGGLADNQVLLTYSEDYNSDTIWESRTFDTVIDLNQLGYKTGSNFTLDLNEPGYYMINHIDFEDESQTYWDGYEGELTLHLDWEYLYPYKHKVNEHITSSMLGKLVNKTVEDYDHYAVSGRVNAENLPISDNARVGTYRYKQQIIEEQPMLAMVKEVFQEKSASYDSFAIWEDPATDTSFPALHLMTLSQPMSDDPSIEFIYLHCFINPDNMDLSCFMFEGDFNESILTKPNLRDLTSTLHGDAFGTITLMESVGQDVTVLETYEGSLHLDLNWEFTDWQRTRNNTRTIEEMLKSHEIRIQESYFGAFSGNVGDFSFIDVESNVSLTESHLIYRKQ